jgi:hypothetical protein
MRHLVVSSIISALLLSSAASAAAPATSIKAPLTIKRFPPVDECMHLDGYFDLRQKFEGIVQRRDAMALTAMISPTISWSFGGEEGKASFIENWKLKSGKASPIWAELDKIVRLGCTADNAGIVMPHMFSQDPGTGDAGAGAALVLGPEVKLRAGPSTATAQKALMNWNVVMVGEQDPTGKWTAVTTQDGKTGYIRNDYLRNFLDYRISFERTAKGWQINFFIAGD